MANQIKHILVIRLSAMGDVAMSVPVIQAFVTQNPSVKITVLTRLFYTPFFKDIPNVSVYTPELKGKHKGFLGIRKLAKELESLKIDVVADLHNVLRSNLLIRFLKLKGVAYQQIDKGRQDKKALVRSKNKLFYPLKTTHERYAEVFRALGFKLNLTNAIFPVPKVLNVKTQEVLIEGKKKIGIAPFAAHKGKMYPLNKMEEVIKELSQDRDNHVFLFGGGKAEKEKLETLALKYDSVTNVAGHFSFEEELAFISNLDIMVSMDSGNGHIAAMYGIPVITIWGVTHPYAGFAPFNQEESNQILPDLEKYPLIPTSIYGKKYPEDYLSCFDTIPIEKILNRVNKILSK